MRIVSKKKVNLQDTKFSESPTLEQLAGSGQKDHIKFLAFSRNYVKLNNGLTEWKTSHREASNIGLTKDPWSPESVDWAKCKGRNDSPM